MPLDLAARTHAFIHGLFKPSDYQQTRERYDETVAEFRKHHLTDDDGRRALIEQLALQASERMGLEDFHPQLVPITQLVRSVLEYEDMFVLPPADFHRSQGVSELWAVRDALDEQRRYLRNYDATCERTVNAVVEIVGAFHAACPALGDGDTERDGIAVSAPLLQSIADPGALVETLINIAYGHELADAGLFQRLAGRIERNLIAASGGNPAADPRTINRAPKLPSKSGISDPAELVGTYLGSTPLLDLFRQDVPFVIPTVTRFEHHHIVAGSGHGKTQTLQYLIGHDLEAIACGERSVVVLDSQGDLIRTISGLAEFAEGGPLADRIVIIDPTDIEWPVSLNLFDVGIERLQGYPPLERERLTNSILELYDFVLGSLLAAEMTQKQSVIFRYVTRLMLHIPDATIHTLRDLMEPGSEVRFAEHIAKLTGTARHFFETEFTSKEFEQTKKQVLRRLWGILENQTFERMFSHPRSKLDLFAEMNAGKVILINTAKDLLKEQGTEIFGRFFIAMIAQAAQERATLPERERMPTFVYVDEAADYFDRNIGIILSQARKYRVGMVLAHQYLGQLEPKLQEAVAANTAVKFAGGVSARDARTLAPMLHCDAGVIEKQPRGGFAVYVRGETPSALPLTFPFGELEGRPTMNADQRKALRDRMREQYAIHHSEIVQPGEATHVLNPSSVEASGSASGASEEAHMPKSPRASSTDATPDW